MRDEFIEKSERLIYHKAKERIAEIEKGIKSSCPLGVGIPREKEQLKKIILEYEKKRA